MISIKEFVNVLETIVPMYFTMAIAFISIKWWKIFTPEQCNGISHYIKVFAIPFLSFEVISSNNFYTMNLKFFLADFLHKVIILGALFLWQSLSKEGSFEWVITLFSVSSFPTIFLMALPVVKAMYGLESAGLVIQNGTFQAAVWINILTILFEYRAVKLLMISHEDGVVSNSFEQHHHVVVKKSPEESTEIQLEKSMGNQLQRLPMFVRNSKNLRSISTFFGLMKISDTPKVVDMQTVTSSRGGVMTGHMFLMLWKRMIRNPNTHATFFGVIWSLVSFKYHIKMPTMLKSCFSMLSNTCVAVNMFNLGTFLALQPNIVSCTIWEAASTKAVRFLVSPAVVAATSKALGLHGIALRTAIIEVVFPQAAFCFVLAKEYNVHPNILSTLVAAGLLIALPIILFYYVLLEAI